MNRKVSLATLVLVSLFLLAIIYVQSNTIAKLRLAPKPVITENTNKDPVIVVPTGSVVEEITTSTPTAELTPEPETDIEITPKELILLDNEYMTLTFERLYEEDYGSDSASKFVNWYMIVYATNKSDQKISFFFEDTTVNDEMTNILSGAEVLPGKSGRFICTVINELLSIDSVKDIEVIETSVVLRNSNYNKLTKPHKITMDFREGE